MPGRPLSSSRPESYSKDAELADTLPEGEQRRAGVQVGPGTRRCVRPLSPECCGPIPAGSREALWAELKAGAESGWDFSSRWLRDPGSLSSIRTSKFVPVDLNAFLCQAEGLMGKFYASLGEPASRAERKVCLPSLGPAWAVTLDVGPWVKGPASQPA